MDGLSWGLVGAVGQVVLAPGWSYPSSQDFSREEVCSWGFALGHLQQWSGPAAFQRHACVCKPHSTSPGSQKTCCILALLSLARWMWGPCLEGDAWGYFSSLGVTANPVEVLLLRRITLLSAVSYASSWQKQESSMEHLFSFTLLLCPS